MKVSIKRRTMLLAMLMSATMGVHAQTNRPVRVVVPGPPGSAMDAYLRATMGAFGERIGHTVVIENLPGAGGTRATAQVARAQPDGLTLEIVSSNHVVNPSLFKSLPYDALESFTPITVIGVVPIVLVGSTTIEATNVPELIQLIKGAPTGSFNYGSLGIGTVLHLAGELFDSEAEVSTTHIPYKDASALISDLVNGEVQMAYLALPSVMQLIQAGKLRALGLTTTQRTPALPDVASIAETLPGYAFDTWLALIAPKGTQQAVVQEYFQALSAVMDEPSVQQAISTQGLTPVMMPPDQAGEYFRTELEKHAALVKRSGAEPQ